MFQSLDTWNLHRCRHSRVPVLAVALLTSVLWANTAVQTGAAPVAAEPPVQALSVQQTGTSSAYLSEPLPASFTVKTRIKTASTANELMQGVWLAGVATAPGQAPVLALSWSQVSDGWFGSMWGVQLADTQQLIPASLSAKAGNGFLDGCEYLRLMAQEPEWGHEYEATLGYTPQSGALSVSVVDLTSGQKVLQQSLQIGSLASRLYPVAGLTTQAQGVVPTATVQSLEVADVNIPQGLEWWVAQEDSTGAVSYVDVVDRRRPTSLVVRTPWQNLPGNLRFVLENEAASAVQLLDVARIESNSTYPVSVAQLAPGKYRLAVQYSAKGRTWTLDQRNLVVGQVTLQLTDIQLEHGKNGTPMISGRLHVNSDGPVPNLSAGVYLDLQRRVFQLDKGAGSIVMEPEYSRLVWQEQIAPQANDAWITFQTEAPLPADSSAYLWQAILRPFATPDALVQATATQSVWIGTDSGAAPWAGFLSDEKETRIPVIPGVDAYHISGRLPAGPIEMFMLKVNLDQPGVVVGAMVGSHSVTGNGVRWPRSQISSMVSEAGAIAGVNSSFFDISQTMVPRGMLIRSGEMLRSPGPQKRGVLGISDDGKPYIGEWQWQGEFRKAGGPVVRLEGINPQNIVYGAALYRAPWLITPGNNGPETAGADKVTEVVLSEVVQTTPGLLRGRVAEVRVNVPGQKLAAGQMVITGRNAAAETLATGFHPGDAVEVQYEISGTAIYPGLPNAAHLQSAASGGVVLMRNGKYGDNEIYTDTSRNPRTAAAISADRRTLYLMVVDGRSTASVGMTYKEMADLFMHMGMFEALNLDGGGSTTLAIRQPDGRSIKVLNTPSDGAERYVADGVGVFYQQPTQ